MIGAGEEILGRTRSQTQEMSSPRNESVRKEEAIDAAIKVLQIHFPVKDPTSLEDYFDVQIVQSDNNKKAWLGQPTIIKSLEKQLGERVARRK